MNLKTKVTRASVATVVFVTAVLSGASFASAQDGGTGAGMEAIGTGIESWVTTNATPVIVSLLLVGMGIALLVRWGKKARGLV